MDFTPKHRIRIKVKQPKISVQSIAGSRQISATEIHKHRMEAEVYERLAIAPNPAPKDIKSAQKALAKIYHPDMWVGFPQEVRDLMTIRAQEIFGIESD